MKTQEIFGIPLQCCPTDLEWIKERLALIPHRELWKGVLSKYSEVYREAYQSEPVHVKKPCAAQRAANLRLLAYTRRFTGVI